MKKLRRLDFKDVRLYAVTPDIKDGPKMLSVAQKLLKGGVDAIQLRSQSLSDRDLLELGRRFKAECERHEALFLMDNRVDLALALQADGVHVGHTDLPVTEVRSLVGHRMIVGMSTHSVAEALAAQKDGADYVSCGPLWATPTKPSYPAVGLGLIGLYNAALSVPFVAIGGIDLANIDSVVRAGAKAVAVVRALFDADDPEQTAVQFRDKVSPSKVEVSHQ